MPSLSSPNLFQEECKFVHRSLSLTNFNVDLDLPSETCEETLVHVKIILPFDIETNLVVPSSFPMELLALRVAARARFVLGFPHVSKPPLLLLVIQIESESQVFRTLKLLDNFSSVPLIPNATILAIFGDVIPQLDACFLQLKKAESQFLFADNLLFVKKTRYFRQKTRSDTKLAIKRIDFSQKLFGKQDMHKCNTTVDCQVLRFPLKSAYTAEYARSLESSVLVAKMSSEFSNRSGMQTISRKKSLDAQSQVVSQHLLEYVSDQLSKNRFVPQSQHFTEPSWFDPNSKVKVNLETKEKKITILLSIGENISSIRQCPSDLSVFQAKDYLMLFVPPVKSIPQLLLVDENLPFLSLINKIRDFSDCPSVFSSLCSFSPSQLENLVAIITIKMVKTSELPPFLARSLSILLGFKVVQIYAHCFSVREAGLLRHRLANVRAKAFEQLQTQISPKRYPILFENHSREFNQTDLSTEMKFCGISNVALHNLALQKLASSDFKIILRINIPSSEEISSFIFDANEHVKTVQAQISIKIPDASKKRLKVCGKKIFFYSEFRLIDHTVIRDKLMNDCNEIDLILVSHSSTSSRSMSSIETMQSEAIGTDEYMVDESDGNGGLSHSELSMCGFGKKEKSLRQVSMWDLTGNFRIEVIRALDISRTLIAGYDLLLVECSLLYNAKLLCPSIRTEYVSASCNPKWKQFLSFDIPICVLPRNTELVCKVMGTLKKKLILEENLIGAYRIPIIDISGFLRRGVFSCDFSKSILYRPFNSRWMQPLHKSHDVESFTVQISFENYIFPVAFPRYIDIKDVSLVPGSSVPSFDMKIIRSVQRKDFMSPIDETSSQIVWKWRNYLITIPEFIPKLLSCANWHEIDVQLEVRRLLRQSAQISAETAILLLGSNFSDGDIRNYAVKALDNLSDNSIKQYLMQLVQALSFEIRMESALVRFLLHRALLNDSVGHNLFWILKTEVENQSSHLLFAILQEAYHLGSQHLFEFYKNQVIFVQRLLDVSIAIKSAKQNERQGIMKKMLSGINIPENQVVPINEDFFIDKIIVDKCRIMDSKKLPLFLSFKGLEFVDSDEDLTVIFKEGDDLRQDMLTLQILGIMDRIWKEQCQRDMKMTVYNCICTGKNAGFIEVVMEAATVSSIQIVNGGSSAAFKDNSIYLWLRQHNKSEEEYECAVQNFTLSCAAYCVATYCLGIGDRHNDNIMCTKSGKLFHIDFGHFLGNTKRKFGIKRENSPFVLTPDFLFVINSSKNKKNFDFFCTVCIEAYLSLRRHDDLILHLFLMMVNSGIPELKSAENVNYIRGAFCSGKSEHEAASFFRDLISHSVKLGWSTQINWWVHNLVHS